MVPINKIEELINKHSLLEKELSSGKTEKKKFAEKSKEYSDLNDIIKQAKQYIAFEKEKNELEKIINDTNSSNEFITMASDELGALNKQNETNEKVLKLVLAQPPLIFQQLMIVYVVQTNLLNKKVKNFQQCQRKLT